MIIIKDRIFKKSELELLDSVNYPEFKEFIHYTETLFKSPEEVFILETQYQRNPEWFAEEVNAGKLTDKDLELKTEYAIISKEEADNFLEMAVWKV